MGSPRSAPSSSAVGLTSSAAGAAPGEPQKYYPTGIRTFARVVPNDTVQATVQVDLQLSQDCRKTYVLEDGEVDGEDLGLDLRPGGRAPPASTSSASRRSSRTPRAMRALATSVAQTGANCVLISALTESGAPLLARQIGEAMPEAQIFGSAGVAESTFTDPAYGGIPLTLDSRVLVTAPAARPRRRAAIRARRSTPPTSGAMARRSRSRSSVMRR